MESSVYVIMILALVIVVVAALVAKRFWAKSKSSFPTQSNSPTTTTTTASPDPFTTRQGMIERGDYIKGAANIVDAPRRDPFASRMARKSEPDFSQSVEEPGYPLMASEAPPMPTTTAFVSYRRKASAILATFLTRELLLKGIDAFVDTRAVDGAGPFPDRLLRSIEERKVFICLLGEDTLDSEWVLREIAHAHSIGKPMIPVFQESYVAKPEAPDEHVAALLQNEGVHILDIRNIYVDEAIQQLSKMIHSTKRIPRP
jgi:hypothetical protein